MTEQIQALKQQCTRKEADYNDARKNLLTALVNADNLPLRVLVDELSELCDEGMNIDVLDDDEEGVTGFSVNAIIHDSDIVSGWNKLVLQELEYIIFKYGIDQYGDLNTWGEYVWIISNKSTPEQWAKISEHWI